LHKHRDNLEDKKTLMFDNVGRKLQQSINILLKKAGSEGASHYSAVSSLYPISRQATRQQVFDDDKGANKKERNMRHSQPDNKNIVNY
jgi:hypothetical protein